MIEYIYDIIYRILSIETKTNRILINDKSKIYIDIDRTYGYISNIYIHLYHISFICLKTCIT